MKIFPILMTFFETRFKFFQKVLQKPHKSMLFTASKYPKRNLDCSLTLQNSSQKKRLGFESDVYHFDTCPRLLGLRRRYIPQKKALLTRCLKEVLKLEEFLLWKAPDQF